MSGVDQPWLVRRRRGPLGWPGDASPPRDTRRAYPDFPFRCLSRPEIADLAWQTEAVAEAHPSAKKLGKAVAEFQTYIEKNAAFIPNYGERYRNGEAISSAIAESAVNQVISKRMVKQQQMRWTPEGAHLLLQVRTCALNDDLRAGFARWYPALDPPVDRQRLAA